MDVKSVFLSSATGRQLYNDVDSRSRLHRRNVYVNFVSGSRLSFPDGTSKNYPFFGEAVIDYEKAMAAEKGLSGNQCTKVGYGDTIPSPERKEDININIYVESLDLLMKGPPLDFGNNSPDDAKAMWMTRDYVEHNRRDIALAGFAVHEFSHALYEYLMGPPLLQGQFSTGLNEILPWDHQRRFLFEVTPSNLYGPR